MSDRNFSLFDNGEAHLDELKTDLAQLLCKLAELNRPKFVPGVRSGHDEDELRQRGEQLKLESRIFNLRRAIAALERKAMGGVDSESAMESASFALEAIINYKYRPALVFNKDHRLRTGDIEQLGLMEDGIRSWKTLIGLLNSLPAQPLGGLSKAVARVEHASGAVVGTAWAFKDQRLVSNRHVFLDQGWYYRSAREATWQPVDGRKGMLNFEAVDGGAAAERHSFSVTDVIASPGPDASRILSDAMLANYLTPVLDKSEILGAGNDETALNGRLVAVVGHPTGQGDSPLDEFDHVFGGAPLKLKRFMPGRLNMQKAIGKYPANGDHAVSVLMHDCSTLKGSSGSCLIDLGPADLDPDKIANGQQKLPASFGKVIGLHFGGLWSRSNFAVPTWDLSALLQ